MKKIIGFIGVILSIIFLLIIYSLNVLPLKYFILLGFIMVILNIIGGILLKKKNILVKFMTFLIYIIIIGISVSGIVYGGYTGSFLNKSFNNLKEETTTYNVITLDKNISDLKDLKNKNIGYLNTDELYNQSIDTLKKEIKFNPHDYNDIFDLYKGLKNKKISAILLDNNYIDTLSEEYNTIYDDINIIYTFDIKTKLQNKDKKVNDRSFNIFISGSDSYSSKLANKSRSDVNMIMTVNRDTKTILLTSIPRDYYVYVHGQKSMKDKLTHAGIYGIDRSVATIEDLFDIDIDYSVKVNMSSVVKVVDLVGGIDIYSDTTFNSYHKKGWTVKKGMNHMNGEKALAYARERYAYTSGDRHRVKNQQQVLEATLKKAMNSKTLLLKYDDLLKGLSSLYRTDIPSSLITSIVKDQINDMSEWKFISISVNGSDASLATYTAPNSKRYVMIPYDKDVKEAKNKIEEILG